MWYGNEAQEGEYPEILKLCPYPKGHESFALGTVSEEVRQGKKTEKLFRQLVS
jgi:hypothetical protein